MASIFKSCPNCGTQQAVLRKRCVRCNYDFAAIESIDGRLSVKNRWQRTPELLAQRIEAQDLNRRLVDGLLIEPDTLALVFQHGECKAVVTSGMYNFSRANEPSPDRPWPWTRVRLDQQASVVLVSAAATVVDLSFDRIQTLEGIPVVADVQLAVQVRDPMSLFINLMQGRDGVTLNEFADLARSAMSNLVANHISGAALDSVLGDLALQQRLDQHIKQQAKVFLSTYGMDLLECRALRLTPVGEAYEKLVRERGERFALSKGVEDLRARYDIVRRGEELKKRRHLDQTADRSEMEEATSAAEHTAGLASGARAHERGLREHVQGDELAELSRATEGRDLDHKLKSAGKIKDVKREDSKADAAVETDVARIRRIAEAESHDEKMRQTLSKVDLADHARRTRISQEDESERKRLERVALDAKIQDESRDREAHRQLDRIRALSEVEQGRLAADLKKTEALRDFSEEQITAMFAKDSPDVAKALAEKYRAQVAAHESGKMDALYERLLAAGAEDRKQSQQFMASVLETVTRLGVGSRDHERAHGEDIKTMAADAMNRMSNVAASAAAPPAMGPRYAAPVPVAGARPSQAATNRVCPRCSSSNPADQRLCTNCGWEYAD